MFVLGGLPEKFTQVVVNLSLSLSVCVCERKVILKALDINIFLKLYKPWLIISRSFSCYNIITS